MDGLAVYLGQRSLCTVHSMSYIRQENIFGKGTTALPHRHRSADSCSGQQRPVVLSHVTQTRSKLKRDCFFRRGKRKKTQNAAVWSSISSVHSHSRPQGRRQTPRGFPAARKPCRHPRHHVANGGFMLILKTRSTAHMFEAQLQNSGGVVPSSTESHKASVEAELSGGRCPARLS